MCLISCTPISKSASRQHHSRCTMKIFIHHTTVAYRTEKKMLKSLSKQSDYDNRYELLNGKVIQYLFFSSEVHWVIRS